MFQIKQHVTSLCEVRAAKAQSRANALYLSCLPSSKYAHHLVVTSYHMIFKMKMSSLKTLDWMSLRMLLVSVAILSLVGYRFWKRKAQRRVR